MTAHTPGKYVMEGELNGKPFTRVFVAYDDYVALKALHDDLLAAAKQLASECAECGGTGIADSFVDNVPGDITKGVRPVKSDCDACANLRAVIAKSEGSE